MRTYRAYHFYISPIEKIEIASAWLTTFPFESYVRHDNGVTAYIPKENIQELIIEDVLAIPFEGVEMVVEVETIAGQNWNAVWESQFHPIQVNDWTIRASFHTPASTPYELIIDPQMSFGTGHHATTQLMLEHLFEMDCQDAVVLDVGTGTGVLAIAAKKRGAVHVTGIDIEDWCVANANANASKNHIHDIAFSTDALHALTFEKQDIILANINRNVLLDHIPKYAPLLKDSGVLLLSGFHVEDVEEISQCIKNQGLNVISQFEKSGWICLKCIF